MEIEYDAAKAARTLELRGLDFARAGEVLSSDTLVYPDTREDYGEDRYITYGVLDGRVVVLVWTPRGAARRIISLRKANERETQRYYQYVD
nr:BrnT family toxin [uncultured Halomonas sp.]